MIQLQNMSSVKEIQAHWVITKPFPPIQMLKVTLTFNRDLAKQTLSELPGNHRLLYDYYNPLI